MREVSSDIAEKCQGIADSLMRIIISIVVEHICDHWWHPFPPERKLTVGFIRRIKRSLHTTKHEFDINDEIVYSTFQSISRVVFK